MRKTIYAVLLALLGISAHAGQATFDFTSDPTSTLEIGGNNPQPWMESGGNPGGFLAITYPVGGQYTGFVFPDIDDGGVITAFRFEADLRVGNSTGDRAADGFSISIARANDPVLGDIGNAGNFAGSIPEGGSTTGIAISFDTWAGNTYSDGGDIEGILVRVDDKTVLRHSVPTRHGACDDATSLQTGPWDEQYWANAGDPLDPASWAGLCWQPLVVNLDEAAKLTVIWKGVTVLDSFQTDFFPSAGRLVLAGRTGGANEHTHIDNIKLTTTASGTDTVAPTAPGNAKAALVGARVVKLTWDAATDNSGRVGYEVEKDGQTPPLLVSGQEWTDSGLLPETTHSYRVRAVDVSGNGSAWQTVTAKTITEVDGPAFLLGEIYDNIPNTDVASFIYSDAFFEKKPSRGIYVNGLDFTGIGDNYGIIISGVLTAPKTGQFDFFVRSDDASQFFLNEGGAAIPSPEFDLWIAEETGCCNVFQEVGATQTTQVPISLTAGKQYGFALVVKEGGGGDFGQVAMREVGDPTPAADLLPIRGPMVSGKNDPTGTDVKITQQPPNTVGEEGSFVAFSVKTEVTSPYGVGAYYQWNKGGQPIVGETRDTLIVRNLSSADEGTYSATIGTMGKVITSNEATLKVVPKGQLPSVGGSGSVEVRVVNGLDDSEEHLTEANAIDITSSDLELGAEGGAEDIQLIGVRFRDIAIPSGATITKASIQFTVDEADDEATSIRIYGELSPESAVFTTVAEDLTSRPKTSASVDWNDIPVWDAASIGSAGPDQQTPDLAAIVQEIITQSGWNGSSMAFLIEPNPGGERTAESFNGDANAAPLLKIEYTTGGGSVDVRVVNGLDDSEEHLTEANAIDITSSDLELGAEGGAEDIQLIGVRFRDIAIPSGVTITKASIQFTVDEADDEPTSIRIYGELSPESAVFTTVAEDLTTRPKTSASVEWNDIPVWDAASIGTAGPNQKTPDLTAIVQEIISQPGWNGSSIAFLIEPNPGGERTAESYDGDANAAPLLHIEYGGGGGGGGSTGGKISIARTATGVTITFEGTLQEAASVTGPFTDVAGATSPATIPFSGNAKFFRAK